MSGQAAESVSARQEIPGGATGVPGCVEVKLPALIPSLLLDNPFTAGFAAFLPVILLPEGKEKTRGTGASVRMDGPVAPPQEPERRQLRQAAAPPGTLLRSPLSRFLFPGQFSTCLRASCRILAGRSHLSACVATQNRSVWDTLCTFRADIQHDFCG